MCALLPCRRRAIGTLAPLCLPHLLPACDRASSLQHARACATPLHLQELPPTWEEYKALVGRWLPGGIFDTKLLAGECNRGGCGGQRGARGGLRRNGASAAAPACTPLSSGLLLPPAAQLPQLFEDTSLGFIHDGMLKGQVAVRNCSLLARWRWRQAGLPLPLLAADAAPTALVAPSLLDPANRCR